MTLMPPTPKQPGAATFSPDEIAKLRDVAKHVYEERFRRNQSALGRALDVRQSAVRRWVTDDPEDAGGMSYPIARKLCELDGTTLEAVLGWPMSRGEDMTQRGDASGRESIADPELVDALGHNYGRWHEAIVAIAAVLARKGERHSKVEWEVTLDELQRRLADMLDRKV